MPPVSADALHCWLRVRGPCPGYEKPWHRSWFMGLTEAATMESCDAKYREWQRKCGPSGATAVEYQLSPSKPIVAQQQQQQQQQHSSQHRPHRAVPAVPTPQPLAVSPPPPPTDGAQQQQHQASQPARHLEQQQQQQQQQQQEPMATSVLHDHNHPSSLHVCLGGEDEPVQFRAEERTCMFKNLCYDEGSREWHYHRDPSLAPPPTFTHVGIRSEKDGKTMPWVDPHVQVEFFEPVSYSAGFNNPFKVKMVDGPIPSDATFVSGLTYYRQAIGPWANAIGHMYAEYIYPIYHAMDIFGVVTRDVRVLMSDTPCRPPKGSKCSHFHTLMRGLSDRYKEFATVGKPNFPPKHSATHSKKGGSGSAQHHKTCYRSLLVGDGTLHGSSRRHPPETWGKFMHYWLSGLGVKPNAKPPQQRIIFVNKGGTAAGGAVHGGANRIALNADAVIKTLSAEFDVPIDNWVWNGETLDQEVAMLQQYSVCITVCGGTAFSCTHLPDGASSIFISVWSSDAENGRPGNNNNMESVTWTWDQRHKHYAYPVWLNETVPDTSIPRDRNTLYGMRWKHNKGFNLHTGRLALLLNDALAQAQWRMFGGDAAAGGKYRPLTRNKLAELNKAAPSGLAGLNGEGPSPLVQPSE